LIQTTYLPIGRGETKRGYWKPSQNNPSGCAGAFFRHPLLLNPYRASSYARVSRLDCLKSSSGSLPKTILRRLLVSDAPRRSGRTSPKRSGDGARRSERSIRLRGNEGWVKKSHAPDRPFNTSASPVTRSL
jgi:hypothetical protein